MDKLKSCPFCGGLSIIIDINGNKRLSIGGFSIQTLANLPKVHRMVKNDLKETINQGIALTEARAYIVKFGTKRQKELLGVER